MNDAPVHIRPYDLQTEADRVAYYKRVDRLRESQYERQERRMKRALDRQMSEALKGGPVELAAERIDPQYIEDAYLSLYSEVGIHFAERVFDDATKATGESIREWLEFLRDLIRTGEVASLIRNVDETTRRIVRNLVGEALDEGLSAEKLARRIRERWTEVNRRRSKVIARTETIRASNYGSVQGAKSTGLDLKKEWIRTYDSRTRDSHALMDRHAHVSLDAPFLLPNVELGGTIDEEGQTEGPAFPAQFPGDPNLPPGQSIQCRCTVAYVTQDL